METFRSYSTEELDTEIAELKRQKSLFSSQNIGSKSYTKDLRELRDQLQAAIRVKNERSQGPCARSFGTTDFSHARF